MVPRVEDRGDQELVVLDREFSPEEKVFICNLKMAGEDYPTISTMFTAKFGKPPPTRQGANKMVAKFRTHFTVMDRRKGKCGRKFTVRTPRNIELVRRSLERAASRVPGKQGPSARRHNEPIKKSSYNNITKRNLKLKPYKILRLHKVTEQQTVARLKIYIVK